MPSSQIPSFASAAAGQASSRDTRGGRGEGRDSGDWARRDNRSANGTVTLRRTSTTPFAQTSTQDAPLPTPSVESSQHFAGSYYEQTTETRYSKAQLLELYKTRQESGFLGTNINNLLHSDFDPGHLNGTNGRSWGKSNDGRDNYGPSTCWDKDGAHEPISMQPMTEEEKSAFAGDVNSPLKPPPQNSNKDAGVQGTNGRKSSVSQGQGNTFGLTSPSTSRPSTRRQQTADSISSPVGNSRFNREESSPFFSRKFTDQKDASEERADESKPTFPFGGLMRSNTAGSALGAGPTSPWGTGSTVAAMSPMGNFGSFPVGTVNPPTPAEKRPGFGSVRGESRLAHLMPKESSEDMSSKTAERPWRPRQRTDTDPFADDGPTGSAALGGGRDNSPPNDLQRRAPGSDTPVRGSNEFGMSDMPGFRDSQQRHNQQTPHKDEYEPMSPSDTNPYASPLNRHEQDDGNYDDDMLHQGRGHGLGGIPEHAPNAFGNLSRGFSSTQFDGGDRSQTSSVGGTKPFPALGGLPSLSNLSMSGWPASGNPVGTPDRETRNAFPSAFGNSLFGSMDNAQSPGLGPIGGMFGGPSAGHNTIGRGSKLGSLFPAAMQAQMHASEQDNPDNTGESRQNSAFGAIGRGTFPNARETDSPMRTGRHAFEDLFPQTETPRNQTLFSSSDIAQGQTATAFPQASSGQSNYQQSQASSDSTSNQLPTAQQRMMVMPDRMRWVYLDPQGQVQGPWSGLEMHDWYKANFFTPDLSVKKVEDTEFEPLGQLIRRIGNSREPFLVPQIGIPHGPVAAPAGTPFTPTVAAPGNVASQGGSVQPPFAGAFPSFGTTLTAEQQNNLERRKQEEQYLMARQREFLAQQQVNMRQMQTGGIPASLHHHSSAHSLQSQPSFGSMTSPIGMPPQPPMPGTSGFFDGIARTAPSQGVGAPADFFRGEEELARLSLQDRQHLFSGAQQQSNHAQQIATMFPQTSEPQRDASRSDQSGQNDPQGFKARLREFEQLREQHDAEEAAKEGGLDEDLATPHAYEQKEFIEPEKAESKPEVLSLTQQVQKAASAKQSPIHASQPESPWAKVGTGLPMPFPPPPQSTTPLPAPNPQRSRSNLPETLHMESRSRSETPEVAPPTLAPWAKETVDTPKGPSLREIQEIEAKKAAKAEEAAIASRRAQQELEIKMMSSQTIAPAPGLPTSSTWGAGSPATPTTVSPWAKPAVKAQVSAPSAASKKTLADIQREEELRKQKLAAAVAQNAQPVPGTSGGKRYADLASKPTASMPLTGGSAWNTVGAGGKVKVPVGPAASSATTRTPSSAGVPSVTSVRAPTRPGATRSASTMGQMGSISANEEFQRWAKSELTKGLNAGIDVDGFVKQLANFPQEAGLIADAVYTNSKLMDGRRFAEEYLRRLKLAEKGIVEPAKPGSGVGGDQTGGWSEVAKNRPTKEEPAAGFKVIANKKKGKK